MMNRALKRARTGHRIDGFRQRELGFFPPRSFEHRVSASEDFVLRLGIHQKLEKHNGCVNTLCFDSAGNIIVTGSDDRMVILWDWDYGSIRLEFESGHSRNVLQAQIMPCTDNRSIVTSGADGVVRHAQIQEGSQVTTAHLSQHEGRAHKIATEPGCPYIFYSCGEDGVIKHFDLRTKSSTDLFVCSAFKDKSDYMPIIHLYSIAIDPRNPNQFVIGGSDEYARVYDTRNYSSPTDCFCPSHLIGDKQVGITGLDYSHQSELIASYNDESIYLFYKDQGLGPSPAGHTVDCISEPQAYRGHRNCNTLKGVKFLGPNCEFVASGSDCGRIFIWRKRDGKLLQVMASDRLAVNCVEAHPFANVLASSGICNDVKIWTPNSEERAPPVNLDQFKIPKQANHCVISHYDGNDSDDEVDNGDAKKKKNDADDDDDG